MAIKLLEFRYNIINRAAFYTGKDALMQAAFEAKVISMLGDRLTFVIDNGGHCSVHVDRSGRHFSGNIIGSRIVRDKFREEGYGNKFELNF